VPHLARCGTAVSAERPEQMMLGMAWTSLGGTRPRANASRFARAPRALTASSCQRARPSLDQVVVDVSMVQLAGGWLVV
jgi:hypothetical protein